MDKGLQPQSLFESAASEVAQGKSVRAAAKSHGIKKARLTVR